MTFLYNRLSTEKLLEQSFIGLTQDVKISRFLAWYGANFPKVYFTGKKSVDAALGEII